MPDSFDFLRTRHFWRFYVRLDESLDDEVLKHFGRTTIEGESYAQSVIALRCNEDCFIDLTITPQLGMVDLGLRNIRTNESSQMGWWDDARWHPFALRWSEINALFQYWRNEPTENVSPSVAFLLLAPFVGHGVEERDFISARKDALSEHYRQLNLLSDTEVAELSDRSVIVPSGEDYTWSHDSELGWLFGGDYPCYSLRNRAHSGGGEGCFPFAEWTSIVAKLPAADGAK